MVFCQCRDKNWWKVSYVLSNLFEMYGGFAYSYPYVILIFSLTIALTLGIGNIYYMEQTSTLYLWIPSEAESLKSKERIDDIYDFSYKVQTIYVTSKEEGENILTTGAFEELIRFEESLWRDFSVNDLTYNDVCLKSSTGQSNESSCETRNSPLMFFINADASFDRSSLSSDLALIEKINSGKGTLDFYPLNSNNYIPIEDIFGGTSPRDITTQEDGTNDILEAQAIRSIYLINGDFSYSISEEIYREFEDIIQRFNESSQHLRVVPYSESLYIKENSESVNRDMLYIYLAITLLVAYSFYVVGQLNTYRSRLFICLFGLLSIGLAYFEAMGLGAYCGVEGNDLVSTIPFLLMGIGLDDMYVLILCLNQTPFELEGKEKFKHMMKNAGVSITITSVTNVSAFAVGTLTTIPAVKNYCIYITLGMLFDFFNQITFFLAVLAYDIRRSENLKGDCCGLFYCTPHSKQCCNGKYIFDVFGDYQTPLSQIFIEQFYGAFLMKKPVKIIILSAFLGLLSFNIYGVTQLEVNFHSEWFVSEENLINDAIEIRKTYFDSNIEIIHYYTLYASFESFDDQKKIDSLEEHVDSCEGCEDNWIIEGSINSWYSGFKHWMKRGKCVVRSQKILLENDIVPSAFFYDCLYKWIADPGSRIFSASFAWEDGLLKAASIQANLIIPEDSKSTIRTMKDTRKISDWGPDRTISLSDSYFWGDHFSVFDYETGLGISISIVVVLIILFVAFGDICGSFLAMLMVGLTVLGILSGLYFWGEYLNIVTMTYIIMTIGVSVDYSSHFVHAFRTEKHQYADERVIKTLGAIGTSIFNGFMSTFLAILPLMFAQHYAFSLFFKSWFVILLYSATHSLVLLPVLLSFIKSKELAKVYEETVIVEKQDDTTEEPEIITATDTRDSGFKS